MIKSDKLIGKNYEANTGDLSPPFGLGKGFILLVGLKSKFEPFMLRIGAKLV